MRKDGQTGMTNLIIAFSKFAKVPNITRIYEKCKGVSY